MLVWWQQVWTPVQLAKKSISPIPQKALIIHKQPKLQVLAIEFVLLAIDFVPLANEFVLLANEFVPLAIELVALAFEFVALARKFVRNKIGSWSEHENKM